MLDLRRQAVCLHLVHTGNDERTSATQFPHVIDHKQKGFRDTNLLLTFCAAIMRLLFRETGTATFSQRAFVHGLDAAAIRRTAILVRGVRDFGQSLLLLRLLVLKVTVVCLPEIYGITGSLVHVACI